MGDDCIDPVSAEGADIGPNSIFGPDTGLENGKVNCVAKIGRQQAGNRAAISAAILACKTTSGLILVELLRARGDGIPCPSRRAKYSSRTAAKLRNLSLRCTFSALKLAGQSILPGTSSEARKAFALAPLQGE